MPIKTLKKKKKENVSPERIYMFSFHVPGNKTLLTTNLQFGINRITIQTEFYLKGKCSQICVYKQSEKMFFILPFYLITVYKQASVTTHLMF